MSSRFSTLSDWLEWLTTLHPSTIDLGLERMSQVAAKLHLIYFSIPVITIGGTNGKGSTVAILSAIYQAAGYRTAAYTSPHLVDFRERLQINNQILSEADWCDALTQIDIAREKISLTYFEFTTLAALFMIKQAALDVIILEVGLGGRLDAVNIVESDIAVITTIDFDHMEYLGNTLDAIGYEKAGIFRANKPAVCGDFATPQTVHEAAESLGAKLYCYGQDFHYLAKQQAWQWYNTNINWSDLPIPVLPLQNAATALQVLYLLQSVLPVSRQAAEQGLQAVRLNGRMQILPAKVPVIVDVTHNPHAAKLLAENLLAVRPQPSQWHAVVGMLKDKDIKGTLAPLILVIKQWYVSDLANERGASKAFLSVILQELNAEEVHCFTSPAEAYQQALAIANPNDAIIVFGSFYTVGEVLQYEQRRSEKTGRLT